MNYKAKIKDILKLNKQAFGDGIFTYKITITKTKYINYGKRKNIRFSMY